MRLWLLRHAEVAAAPGLCYGASDLPADPDATRRAAARLAHELPPGLALWCSPLQRCAALARELQARRPDLRLQTDVRLREFDFGAWEGRPWATIARPEFDTWLADFGQARPGGDGENVAELMGRVGAAWDAWRAAGQDAAWVSHAGVIRAARLLARGVREVRAASDWPAEGLDFGAALLLRPG